MDIRNFIRPIIAGLVGLGLVIIIIVLIVRLFSGHGSKPLNQVDITKYSDTAASATLLIDSYTNLNQNHSQLKIIVSGTQNELDIINGYQGTVTATRTYPNNSAAFGVFLQSLKLLDYAKGQASGANYSGYCPTGDRYTYSFNDGQTDLFSFWSTSCGKQGTFQGNAPAVRQLFERQVQPTDLSQLASGTHVLL